MRTFFLIENDIEIEQLIEIQNIAHAITDKGTFKLREVMHSNSHVYMDANEICEINNKDVSSGYYLIDKVYETVPLDENMVLQLIPRSYLNKLEFIDLEKYMSKEEAKKFKKKHELIIKDNFVAKIKNEEIVKVLKYMQSLNSIDEFRLWDECIKNWAYNNFGGKNQEIGFYILLDKFNDSDFINKWADEIFDKPNLEELINYIKNRGRKEEQILIDYLIKFK